MIVVSSNTNGLHECVEILNLNRVRSLEGESTVSVFMDFDERKYTLRVGLEFVPLSNICPFCKGELHENK